MAVFRSDVRWRHCNVVGLLDACLALFNEQNHYIRAALLCSDPQGRIFIIVGLIYSRLELPTLISQRTISVSPCEAAIHRGVRPFASTSSTLALPSATSHRFTSVLNITLVDGYFECLLQQI